MKFDTRNQNLLINGEKVDSISFKYDDLLKDGPIRANKPKKEPLIVYHLVNRGSWTHTTKVIIEAKK